MITDIYNRKLPVNKDRELILCYVKKIQEKEPA